MTLQTFHSEAWRPEATPPASACLVASPCCQDACLHTGQGAEAGHHDSPDPRERGNLAVRRWPVSHCQRSWFVACPAVSELRASPQLL